MEVIDALWIVHALAEQNLLTKTDTPDRVLATQSLQREALDLVLGYIENY